MSTDATIPLDEIVPGATVRMTVIDQVQYLSVRDVLMHICGKNNKQASQIWERLSDEKKEELNKDIAEYHFLGQGQRKQAVITVDGALKLIMMIPGKRAKNMRVHAADIISRYVSGNESLVAEIHENKRKGSIFACSKLMEQVKIKSSERQEMPPVSYVYATKTDAFPNLIKIGRSSNVDARVSSLNTSCAPAPHYTVAVCPTFNAARDEALAHTFFASSRREGEFFEVEVQAVKIFFTNHIMTQYQLELGEFIAKVQGDL